MKSNIFQSKSSEKFSKKTLVSDALSTLPYLTKSLAMHRYGMTSSQFDSLYQHEKKKQQRLNVIGSNGMYTL